MAYKIDYSLADSRQIEQALSRQLEDIRLARNMTQKQLAQEAGISLRTVSRIAKGEGSSFDTIIRVMSALGIQQNLAVLLPDPSVRPMERAKASGKQRQRARPDAAAPQPDDWIWGDDGES